MSAYGPNPLLFHQELTHSRLIDYMVELGYQPYGGFCFGLNVTTISSILLGELKQFRERLAFICEDILAKIEFGHYKLTDRERHKLGITALLDGIALYSSHALYPFVADAIESIPQHEINISLLVGALAIEKQGGLIKSADFCGVYTSEELTAYFKSLKDILLSTPAENRQPFGLLITNTLHSVGVSYDDNLSEWIFIDVNHGGNFIFTYKNTEQIAKAVMYALVSPNMVAFNTHLLSLGKNSSLFEQISKTWLGSASMIDAHIVTSEKSKFTDTFGVSLLKVATYHGHLATLKAILNFDQRYELKDESAILINPVARGHTEVVKTLLSDKRMPSPNIVHQPSGFTPLSAAAYMGHLPVVKALLDDPRTDPLLADWYGESPVYLASHYGHKDVQAVLEIAVARKRTPAVTDAEHNPKRMRF